MTAERGISAYNVLGVGARTGTRDAQVRPKLWKPAQIVAKVAPVVARYSVYTHSIPYARSACKVVHVHVQRLQLHGEYCNRPRDSRAVSRPERGGGRACGRVGGRDGTNEGTGGMQYMYVCAGTPLNRKCT